MNGFKQKNGLQKNEVENIKAAAYNGTCTVNGQSTLTCKMIFWRNFNFQFPVLSEPPPTSLSRIRSQCPLERRFVEEILQKETSSSSSLYLMKARKNTISAQKMCYFEQKMSFHILLVNMSSRLFFFKWIQLNFSTFLSLALLYRNEKVARN